MMMEVTTVSRRAGGKIFSYFLGSQSLFICGGVNDGGGHPSRFGAREGEACMKVTDHAIRHPRGHPGQRASALGTRGWVWSEDQVGRGQNSVLGWSDPTFAHGSVAKVMLGSLQPTKGIRCRVCPCPVRKPLRKIGETIFFRFCRLALNRSLQKGMYYG
jgi:hypothetical protein